MLRALLAGLVLLGCSGSSPTDAGSVVVVDTVLGSVVVYDSGLPWDPVEVQRQVRELEIIYADETGTGVTPPLVGVSIQLEPGPWRQGGQAVRGSYDPASGVARIAYDQLAQDLVRHELGHALCYQEQLPCDCARVDHPGGYDLGCRRL